MVPPSVELHVAAKLVIGRPLSVPDENGTRSPEPERVTTPTEGALGTVAGMIEFDAAEFTLVPTPLVAFTLHEYVLPLVSPFTMIGLVAPLAETGVVAPMSADVHVTPNDVMV